MSKYLVYIHINKINGKKYIGITSKNPIRRWGKDGSGYKGQRFYNAIQKYGWNNFKHVIIADNLTENEAKELEVKLIAKYKTTDDKYGYNMTYGGELEIPNEIVRRKISEANKNRVYSKETRKKIGEANSKRIISEETRRKMSESSKGKTHSLQTKMKLRKLKLGFKHTEEAKRKMSENHIDVSGKNNPMYGKKFTDEHRRKISESLKGKLVGDKNPMYGRKRSGELAGHYKRVLQLSLDNKVIREFINITEAAKATGATRQHISKCCKGERNQTGGYKWRYADEYLESTL